MRAVNYMNSFVSAAGIMDVCVAEPVVCDCFNPSRLHAGIKASAPLTL